MQTQTTMLKDLTIYAHYFGVPIEVDPVLEGGFGRYTEGTVRSHKIIELALDGPEATAKLTVGAAYCATGITTAGQRLTTHWLYCLSTDPTPSFGISINWTYPHTVSPLLGDTQAPWVHLENLIDLTMTWASPPPSLGVSQSQIGRHGCLVMTSLTMPVSLGILIKDPTLPPAVAEGSKDIAITAKCTRTLQSIGFTTLTCVDAGDPALFLQPAS